MSSVTEFKGEPLPELPPGLMWVMFSAEPAVVNGAYVYKGWITSQHGNTLVSLASTKMAHDWDKIEGFTNQSDAIQVLAANLWMGNYRE